MPRCKTFCLKCYSGIRGRKAYKNHACWHEPKPEPHLEDVMALLNRKVTEDAAARGAGGAAACQLSGEYANAWEFLTACSWPDGKKRVTGTMLVFMEDGMMKANLHDRDAEKSTFVAGGSLSALLRAVDSALIDPDWEWRPKPRQVAAQRRR